MVNQNWKFVKLTTAIQWCVIVALIHWCAIGIMFMMIRYSDIRIASQRADIEEMKSQFASIKSVGVDDKGNVIATFKPLREGEGE